MAAPGHTNRTTPTGNRMDDGYQSLIAFARWPDIKFWEKTVQPPGIDGGDAINTATMHNVSLRTFGAKGLRTNTEVTTKVAYDPMVHDQISQIVNLHNGGDESSITVHFPISGNKVSFRGFLKSFVPDELVEGQQPEATIVIVITNADSDAVNSEDDMLVGT